MAAPNRTPTDFDAKFADILARLTAGDETPLERLFAETGDLPPRIVWDPSDADLPDPTLRAVRAHWQALRRGRTMPDWRDLHAETLGIDLVHLAVVDPLPDQDFRFVVYGSAVSNVAWRSYEGETLREMGLRTGVPGPVFYRAVYAVAARRRLAVFTWNAAPPWQAVTGWNRLVLPFVHPGGTGLRFLVAVKSEGKRAVAPDAVRTWRERIDAVPTRV
jgi:hypothetical protein